MHEDRQYCMCAVLVCMKIDSTVCVQYRYVHLHVVFLIPNTLLCNTLLCNILLCNILLCNILLCNILLCNILLCNTLLCNILLCNILLCNILLCHVVGPYVDVASRCEVLRILLLLLLQVS